MFKRICLALLISAGASIALELPDAQELSKTADCAWFTIMELPPLRHIKITEDIIAGRAEYLGSDGSYGYVAATGKLQVIGETVYYFAHSEQIHTMIRAAHYKSISTPSPAEPPPLQSMATPLQYVLWYYSRKDKLRIAEK